MKLVHPIKIIIKLCVCFVITFTPMPSLAAFEWPYFELAISTMTDPTFIVAIGASSIEADKIAAKLDVIKNDMTTKALPAAKTYQSKMQTIEKQVINELNANTEWVENSKPNPNYGIQLDRLKATLAAAALVSDKKLKDIEDAYFNGDPASKNMSEVYGKNNSAYKNLLFTDKPFCPTVVSKIPGIPASLMGVSYTELQVAMCNIVYNVIAYKEEVNKVLVEKDTSIGEATNDTIKGIIKLPSKTIGDHNARQTALETLRLLRKVAMNDNDIRLHNAETEAEISQEIRKYATNIILTGLPKKADDEMAATAFKLVLSTVLGTVVNTVAPYNQ